MNRVLITTVAAIAAAGATSAATSIDWPSFQGPNGNGTTALEGANFDWSEGGPEVSWKLDIGPGYGGAAIRDGEVFLLDRELGERDILRVMDLETGEEKWSYDYEAEGRLSFPGSRTVPAVTDKHVYIAGGFGHVHCISRDSHEPVWATHVEEVYGGVIPMFGWSSAPVIVDDLVIITALGEEVGLIAFDRMTGEEVWITEGLGFSHSTPTVLNLLGEDVVVFMSTNGQASGQDQAAPTMISAFRPADGSLVWRHETLLTRLPIPGPVRIDDDHFFVTGGYRGGSTLVKISKTDSKYAFEDLFHVDRGAQIHIPLLYQDHLYVLVNENWNNSRNRQSEGGLMCLSLEGEEKWRTGKDPFIGRGNAVLAGDHLLIQDGFNGILRVVKPTPEGYELVAEANVFEVDDRSDHQMWGNMALSDGRLVMRSDDALLCVKL